MMKMLASVAVVLSLVGCSGKLVSVKAGSSEYAFKERGAKNEAKDDYKRIQQIVDPLFTPPRYMVMFDQAQQADKQAQAAIGGLNQHHARSAMIGGALATSPLAGTALGSMNVLNLGASLLEAGYEKSVVEMKAQGYYNLPTDGSITIAKWMPGLMPHEAAAQAYEEIKKPLADRCAFKETPNNSRKFGEWRAELWGRCTTKGNNAAIVADSADRFKDFHQVMGDGALVTHYFFASMWKEEERKDLAKYLRETLPAGWYVMRAMPIENQATGQMEPMYMVSKGGQHKVFPLPPKPQFK